MTQPDLEQLLDTAAELERLRDSLRRAEAIEHEIAELEEVVAVAPRVREAAHGVSGEVEPVARELEREWVAQGPLVTGWEYAYDLVQQAESAGADSAPYRADADAARRSVEAARLATREQRERLARQRERLADVLLDGQLEIDPPPPVADDSRPEALRRDALELMRLADEADRTAGTAASAAGERVGELRAELDTVGHTADLQGRLAQIEQALPAEVELGPEAPPSAAMRLRRAGLRVR
jgi:hypothetical protein